MTLVFVAVAIVGVVLLLLALLFDDALDAVLPESEWISLPAIGAFLAAGGIVGWMAQSSQGWSTGVALAGGAAAGLVLAFATLRATRSLMNSPTDAPPRTSYLVGVAASVVTPVRADGLGEVMARLSGRPTKLTATSDTDLSVGEAVVVIEVLSETKVRVQRANEFWAE